MIHFILLSAFLTILISIHASSIKLENLLNIGCTSCLSFKFGAAPSECFGPYLFIGALNSSGGVFHRGTLDFSQAAVPTHPREIVWKFSPGFSFGLAVDKSRLLREDTNLLGSDQDELNRQRKTNGVSFYQSTSGWERLVLNCPGQFA